MWWPVARRRTVARWRSLLVLAARLLPLRLLTVARWRSMQVLAARLLWRPIIGVLLIRHESFSPLSGTLSSRRHSDALHGRFVY